MPRVQFTFQSKNVNIVKDMHSPKKIGDINAWLKAARQTIPEIPITGFNEGIIEHVDDNKVGWFITFKDATQKFIRWDIENTLGERCYVVIARKQGSPI